MESGRRQRGRGDRGRRPLLLPASLRPRKWAALQPTRSSERTSPTLLFTDRLQGSIQGRRRRSGTSQDSPVPQARRRPSARPRPPPGRSLWQQAPPRGGCGCRRAGGVPSRDADCSAPIINFSLPPTPRTRRCPFLTFSPTGNNHSVK